MTKIEWTERSWNPIIGCSIVSPGCTNCYAMRTAHRLGLNPATPQYADLTRQVNGKPVWTGEMRFLEPVLAQPLAVRRPTVWFVNSMSDLFAEGVKAEWLDRVFAIMARCERHTFQILTKRADRMRAYMSDPDTRRRVEAASRWPNRGGAPAPAFPGWPLPNVWLGVSVEDQRRADERIPDLLASPAAIRWISAEPLLGPVDLTNVTGGTEDSSALALNALTGLIYRPNKGSFGYLRDDGSAHLKVVKTGSVGMTEPHGIDIDRAIAARLDWVVVGGESGRHARPMHPEWARQLRDQCAAGSVAFFFKQWGEWTPGENAQSTIGRAVDTADWFNDRWAFERLAASYAEGMHIDDGPTLYRAGKKAAGRRLDGQMHEARPCG